MPVGFPTDAHCSEGLHPFWIPPTIQPVVGFSMKIDVKFASSDNVGVPLMAMSSHEPTPPDTVYWRIVALSPTAHPLSAESMKTELSGGVGVGLEGEGKTAHVPTPPETV